MLPQPGLQAEEINVEISWRWDPASGCPLAGFFIISATGVVETPAHQAHLEEREYGVGGCHSSSSKPQSPWFLQSPLSSPYKTKIDQWPVIWAVFLRGGHLGGVSRPASRQGRIPANGSSQSLGTTGGEALFLCPSLPEAGPAPLTVPSASLLPPGWASAVLAISPGSAPCEVGLGVGLS